VANDGVRDIPDVSLMASNGFWGTSYAVCISDPTTATGNGPCQADPATWLGFGGTSISSPIWAGIQALVNQATSQSWGNANTVLYSLARNEYGSAGKSTCNSSLGNAVGSDCVFYDVTQGDITVLCTGSNNCFNNGGTYGVLSTSNSAFQPAYPATLGWDFATGIGTTNATNIVNAWAAYASPATTP
jgi:subtilase family serine protease